MPPGRSHRAAHQAFGLRELSHQLPDGSPAEEEEPAVEECKRLRKFCADKGLIVGIGGFWSNVIRIQPPLTISRENVDEGMEVFEKAARSVEKSLK